MKYKIIISDKANEQIKQNLAFISKVSKAAAKVQNTEFKNAIKSIKEDPKSYKFLSEEYLQSNKYRKYVVSKRYIILYQIIEETVYIEFVIDTRTDYNWLIK